VGGCFVQCLREWRSDVPPISIKIKTEYTASTGIRTQRHNTENSKQIFPEKEVCGVSPNFHIHVSVSDLYIPRSDCLFCCRKIQYVDRSWEYINRSQTLESGNWDRGLAISRKGIHKWDFRCSAVQTIINTYIYRGIMTGDTDS
jgi:hypothetical protein